MGRFIEMQFLSLDGSTTTMTAHPAASRPSIRLRPVEASEVEREMVVQLAISGQYAICEYSDPQDDSSDYTIEVYNWKTGRMIWVRTTSFKGHALVGGALRRLKYSRTL